MNVVVCFKSVYDDVAIRTNSDKTLDYQAVPHIVSLYDLSKQRHSSLRDRMASIRLLRLR